MGRFINPIIYAFLAGAATTVCIFLAVFYIKQYQERRHGYKYFPITMGTSHGFLAFDTVQGKVAGVTFGGGAVMVPDTTAETPDEMNEHELDELYHCDTITAKSGWKEIKIPFGIHIPLAAQGIYRSVKGKSYVDPHDTSVDYLYSTRPSDTIYHGAFRVNTDAEKGFIILGPSQAEREMNNLRDRKPVPDGWYIPSHLDVRDTIKAANKKLGEITNKTWQGKLLDTIVDKVRFTDSVYIEYGRVIHHTDAGSTYMTRYERKFPPNFCGPAFHDTTIYFNKVRDINIQHNDVINVR